jgi:hypothetical protein
MYLCINVSMHLCIHTSMYPYIYVSIHLCIYVSMYLRICGVVHMLLTSPCLFGFVLMTIVFQTLQVVWIGAALFTLHIIRRASERLLPDSTRDKLQALAQPVVMLLPASIRERVGVAADKLEDYETSTMESTTTTAGHMNGIDNERLDKRDSSSSSSSSDAGSVTMDESEAEKESVVHHKLSMIQQLNRTVQQVDDAQQLVGTAASYSEKLLNALAFEDRYVSLVLYTLLFAAAVVSSASIVVGQLVWVLVAPLLMWPSTGEVLFVAINVALLPLEKLLGIVPRSWREEVLAKLSALKLSGGGGGLPDMEVLGSLLPAPVGNVLKRAPDDLQVAHRVIAKQMFERSNAGVADDQSTADGDEA